MATHTLPLDALQSALGVDADDLPYDVQIHDDSLTIETANTGARPPTATVCALRKDGYTFTGTYRPESNDVLFKHAGPSIRFTVTLDELKSLATPQRTFSDLQRERAMLYANREWDRPTCTECGRLVTADEIQMLRQVKADHPDEVTGARCKSHQTTLYNVMEYNPWEPQYVAGGDNRVPVGGDE